MFQKRTDGTLHASLWRNIINAIAAFAIFFVVNGFKMNVTTRTMLVWCVIYALTSVVSGITNMIGLTYAKMATITFYMLLGGMVVPFVFGIFYYHEKPTICQWIGFAVMLVSMAVPFVFPLVMKKKNGTVVDNSDTVGITKKGKVIATICEIGVFFMNGGNSVITTLAGRDPGYSVDDGKSFLLMSNILITIFAVICVPAVAAIGNKKSGEKKFRFLPNDSTKNGEIITFFGLMILFIIALGFSAFNGFGSIFSMKCASMNFPASIQYPMISVACIALSTLFGFVLFKEKPSFPELLGIIVSFVGIVLFMF